MPDIRKNKSKKKKVILDKAANDKTKKDMEGLSYWQLREAEKNMKDIGKKEQNERITSRSYKKQSVTNLSPEQISKLPERDFKKLEKVVSEMAEGKSFYSQKRRSEILRRNSIEDLIG